MLVNMVDFGMNVQEAGDARFLHDGGNSPYGAVADSYGTLYLEPGVPEGTVDLRAWATRWWWTAVPVCLAAIRPST